MKSYAPIRVLTTVISLLFLPLSLAQAATYYVDNNNTLANDANIGSSALPFKTISRAATIAAAGDTVIVNPGTYTEVIQIANSGTSTAPITFKANGAVVAQAPVVDGWQGVFNILGKSDIVIAGFTVQNAYYGLRVERDRAGIGAARITLKNNHVMYTKASGIYIGGATNVVVSGNVVEKTNYGGIHEMITLAGVNGFDVRNNEIFNGKFIMNGVAMHGKEGFDAKSGSSNGRVANNLVHDLLEPGIYADAWKSLEQNIKITGNIVYNCKQGIALSSEQGGLMKNILVANNITHHNTNAGIIVSPWGINGPREDIRIQNNTVYGNGLSGISIATTNVYLLDIRNNISADNGGPNYLATDPGLITVSAKNLLSGRYQGNVLSGILLGDPAFVNAAAADFRLNSTSAAANVGATLTQVTVDINGVARPLGGAYDIGAFESH